MSIHNGSYRPNAKGATSLRDARQLHVGNDPVTVEVYPWEGGQWMTIFVGCKAAFEGPMPAGIEYHDDFYGFIHETVEAFAADRAVAEPIKAADRKDCDASFCILDRGHATGDFDWHVDATGTTFTRNWSAASTHHNTITG